MKARLYHLIFAIASMTPLVATAGNEWAVGRDVPSRQRISMNDIDHTAWDAMLRKYVDEDGLVDYASWKRNDLKTLDAYLNELSRAERNGKSTREARLAYWINAYNAVTVRGMLREYPTSSIRNHTAKIWGYNIWTQLYLQVDDGQINLDSIEHQVLRKMGDPRIHFGIVCASIGCPRLLNEAYVPATLDEQLDRNARDFFSRSQNFQVKGNTAYLSSILDWFGEDFGNSTAAQLRRIAEWAPERYQASLKSGRMSVDYLDYNWDINAQK